MIAYCLVALATMNSMTGENAGMSSLNAAVTYLQYERTADTNVLLLVLARWLVPPRTSFAVTQHQVARRTVQPGERCGGALIAVIGVAI
jgi:hypothetical protein